MATDRKLLVENAIEDINRKATNRQVEAGELYFRALTGDRKAAFKLAEGISTSDIPTLLAPAINVQFLAQYADQATVWQEIAEEVIDAPYLGTVEFGGFDFDTSALNGVNNGETYVGAGMPAVSEYGEYPAIKFTTETLNATLGKAGLRLRVSWESILKSANFDMIGRSTAFFARHAAEQEDIALAKQFISTAGVVNSAFTAITGHPDLTLASLEAALAQGSRVKVGGRPLNPRSWKLVVPTTLSLTARNILSITEVNVTPSSSGGDAYRRTPATGNVSVVDFWALEAVGNFTTAGTTDDWFFLVPQGGARPAIAEVFLSGYRTPLISIKDSGHFSFSGGQVPSREGAFLDDSVETRGRHVVGAAVIEEAGILYSNGS